MAKTRQDKEFLPVMVDEDSSVRQERPGLDTVEGLKATLREIANNALDEGRYNEATTTLRELAKISGFDRSGEDLSQITDLELRNRLVECTEILSDMGIGLTYTKEEMEQNSNLPGACERCRRMKPIKNKSRGLCQSCSSAIYKKNEEHLFPKKYGQTFSKKKIQAPER